MKRLMGKTEVDDALERLDMLTQEENLMTMARTFEATHDVNVNVKALKQHVDTKVTVIEDVIQQVDGNVRATQEGTRTIDDNVKITKSGALIFQFLHTQTDHPSSYVETVIDDLRSSSPPDIIINRRSKMYSQEINRAPSFDNGSLLRTLPSIIILHVAPSTTGQQNGLSRVVHSMSGRRTVLCCGSVGIVCFSCLVILYDC
jgi:hypothetical protein